MILFYFIYIDTLQKQIRPLDIIFLIVRKEKIVNNVNIYRFNNEKYVHHSAKWGVALDNGI